MTDKRICKTCGFVHSSQDLQVNWTSGISYIFITILLLLLGILPGVVFILYLVFRHKRCTVCKGTELIPLDTPASELIIKQFNIDINNLAPNPKAVGKLSIPAVLGCAMIVIFVLGIFF